MVKSLVIVSNSPFEGASHIPSFNQLLAPLAGGDSVMVIVEADELSSEDELTEAQRSAHEDYGG